MIGNPYKGRSFKGLIQYLFHGRADDPNPHRVEWHVTRNIPIDDPDALAAIMRAGASANARVERPVYHLPLSWPPDESLDRATQLAIAEQLLADLGLSEHQCVIIAHNDGQCPHVHLCINTVHPHTGKVWNAWRDVYRIMDSLERQEQERGLRIVERPDLEEWRAGKRDPERKRKVSREERLRAEREGDSPLVAWSERDMRDVRNAVTKHFRDARSWEDLENRLRQHALHLQRAGQGFRITDGKHFMTMSKVGKQARWDLLEERFARTWADYEQTRSLTFTEQAQLEQPRALRALRKQQPNRKVPDWRVRVMVYAWLTHSGYEAFRAKEHAAALEGAKLVRLQRAIRNNRWSHTATAGRHELARSAYADLMAQVYRNPTAAMKKLEAALRADRDWHDIDLRTIGKLRGTTIFGRSSDARKMAERNMKRVRYMFTRQARLAARIEVLETERPGLVSQLAAQERAYIAARSSLGDREARFARRLELDKERKEALRAINTDDIAASSLHPESKKALTDAVIAERLRTHERRTWGRGRGPDR